MGPVSFERVGTELAKDRMLGAAQALKAAGIAVQSADPERGILVRSEDVIRAKALLDNLA